MKRLYWYIFLGSSLLAISVASYLVQVHFFNRLEDTFFYMLQDIAFVPIQVLMVTLILDKLLKKREKQALLDKLNMIIGVFFHYTGTELIELFGKFTHNYGAVTCQLKISTTWKDRDFSDTLKNFNLTPDQIDIKINVLKSMKGFLMDKRDSLLNLLANPNLLEHDRFTDLLWAVFHLTDELFHRESLSGLPQSDLEHLKGDIIRAYRLLVYEWLSYMKHLKNDYPYLYSIAVRTNPFEQGSDIIVK